MIACEWRLLLDKDMGVSLTLLNLCSCRNTLQENFPSFARCFIICVSTQLQNLYHVKNIRGRSKGVTEKVTFAENKQKISSVIVTINNTAHYNMNKLSLIK